MDWRWVYGTLVRNTGLTFQQWEEESASRALDFLEHLEEYPPDYVILAARYLSQAKKKPVRKLTEEQMAEQSNHLRAMMPTAPIPPHLRDLIAWSKEQDKLAGKG